jgi:hypothetical protein
MYCDVIRFLSNDLCVLHPRALAREEIKHKELDKIISHHKTRVILFITCLPPYVYLFSVYFISRTSWRRNTQWYQTFIIRVLSHGYQRKYVITIENLQPVWSYSNNKLLKHKVHVLFGKGLSAPLNIHSLLVYFR